VLNLVIKVLIRERGSQRKRFEDVALLALKMEGGSMNKGMKVTFGR
jgi:hypothetical protein